MFPTFHPHKISTSTHPPVTIHTLTSPPTGPPLLLLHGFPQNLNIWHRITPHLTSHYTLTLLDLRGYGQSSKPRGGPNHEQYSKSAMAADCVAVMTHLGHENFYICAHDRGARVAHKLCVEYPERVKRALFLDICPTLAMYNKTDFAFASAYWHWFFLIQPAPLPESLMVANPRSYIENTLGARHGAGIEVFDKSALESYVVQMGDAEGVHGMCEDYRAAAGVDLVEQKADAEAGRKIKCAVRVLWGRRGVIEKLFDAVGEWRKVCGGLVEGESLDCGHYIPEEAPEVLVKHIEEFLRE
ncbi:hypothetical protein N7G274_005881 [Stereocaulon virgatum]|uniref:AB hydrolase-1 domain-containing protein n=1 Tax=Stereocaulon virgatum TaxID=373712 RepID=A0ABR4A7L8_9LECA